LGLPKSEPHFQHYKATTNNNNAIHKVGACTSVGSLDTKR
jgi:hypothetical protein